MGCYPVIPQSQRNEYSAMESEINGTHIIHMIKLTTSLMCEIQKRWSWFYYPWYVGILRIHWVLKCPCQTDHGTMGPCSHDSPSEMWGICSSRSGRNSSRFQSWSMIQPPVSWASRQDPADGCDMVWHRFWGLFPEIGYRKNTEISGFRVESDSFWMILRSPPPGNQRMSLRATLTSWKWWLDYSTRSPDQDDVRDRHCQDGWEEQGRFLDLGWWGVLGSQQKWSCFCSPNCWSTKVVMNNSTSSSTGSSYFHIYPGFQWRSMISKFSKFLQR